MLGCMPPLRVLRPGNVIPSRWGMCVPRKNSGALCVCCLALTELWGRVEVKLFLGFRGFVRPTQEIWSDYSTKCLGIRIPMGS